MSTHLPPPSPSSPSASSPAHRKSWARRIERCCCGTLSYFPLTFVYGLTTWAVFVEIKVSFLAGSDSYAYLKAGLGLLFYSIANISYTIAVFTPAGSPLDPRQDLSLSDFGKKITGGSRGRGAYDVLPTYEHESPDSHIAGHSSTITTVTAKSSGKQRYCKKCQTLKPDRTHHCSSCKRCVLKMDHHCPWLATCVGLRNYKPFLLFLIYTCVFCWLSCLVSGSWVWAAISNDSRLQEGMIVVNVILLTVLSGIIGLVLSGFTGWHIYLAVTGQTTIESLEKTRYLNPLKQRIERSDYANALHPDNGDPGLLEQLKESHKNALPGVLRPEEGEASRSHSPNPPPSIPTNPHDTNSSPAQNSLQRSYASLENAREHDRYNRYLDETATEKLPNAFNLGWKRNLLHIFGERALFWALPICNTSGDGWDWEVSPQWIEARAEMEREREARGREEESLRALDSESLNHAVPGRDYRWQSGQGFVSQGHYRGESSTSGGAGLQMQPLDRRKQPPMSSPTKRLSRSEEDVDYDTSGDDDEIWTRRHNNASRSNGTANWNDIPDDFLRSNGSVNRSRSQGRQKGD